MRRHFSILAAAVVAAGVPTAAHAATASGCTTIRDTITKTDSGHGTPAEWADLVLRRSTEVCKTETGYTVHLKDNGHLWTRPGAGTPNGTGGTIKHRVRGTVIGHYDLTVSGGTLAHRHGDTSLSSTEYVRSLFSADAQVTGGDYTWTYTTCAEKWVDSSTNNDGQGATAGNITGKRCHAKKSPTPSPSPTSTGSPSSSPTGTPTPTTSPTSPAGGEAPPAQPVPGTPHFTG